MPFAISQCTELNLLSRRSDVELELTFITNELSYMAMQSQSIVEKQAREGQIYMSQHVDEEGQVDISAIEYVNSEAFNSKYQAQLSAIQTKEQKLELRKTQLETEQKTISTQQDGWEKNTDKNIQSGFKYGG